MTQMPQLERVILLFRHLYKSNPMKKDERRQFHIEVLDQLLGHDDLSFESLILFLKFLLCDRLVRHLGAILDSASLFLQTLSLSLELGRLVKSSLLTLLLLECLTLLAKLLLLLELLSLLEQFGSLQVIFLGKKPILGLFLLSGKLSFLSLHCLTLKSLSLETLLHLTSLLRLSFLFPAGDLSQLCSLLSCLCC